VALAESLPPGGDEVVVVAGTLAGAERVGGSETVSRAFASCACTATTSIFESWEKTWHPGVSTWFAVRGA
jgi:hypothetical protein